MVDNVLRIAFKGKTSIESKPLYQYDYGQKIKFVDLNLPVAYEVHFSNRLKGNSTTQLGNVNGVIIPDMYLQSGLPIYVWVFLHTGQSDGETEYMVTIPVIQRAAPSADEPTPQQESAIGQAVQALNSAVAAIGSSEAAAVQAATEAETYRSTTRVYMELTQGYVNRIEGAVASGYITLGNTQLTEAQLIKLLQLIED